MTSDDVVPRILAAIEETEDCALLVQEGRREWRVAEVGFEGYAVVDAKGARVVTSKQLGVDHHIARHDPASALRGCVIDRRRLERHAPIPDHGRFSDDWANECPNPGDCDCGERPKVCGACRDQAGDPLEAPCPDLLDLADSYGMAPTKETADE